MIRQCAAVSIHLLPIIAPPQKCLLIFRNETINVHFFMGTLLPPTTGLAIIKTLIVSLTRD